MTGALTLSGSPVTMSSREIAQLTGKDHFHVMRDVRNMLAELGEAEGGYIQKWRHPQNGQEYDEFRLNRELTDTLLTGYSAILRRKVVARWHELEQRNEQPKTPAEMFLASAQALVNVERQQAVMQEELVRLDTRVDQLAESRVWDHCPQNCESLSRICTRMHERYNLTAKVVGDVMRNLPNSPKPHGMVRNTHEFANNRHYEVWAVADVSKVFRRFVAECYPVSAGFYKHPDIEGRFKMQLGAGVASNAPSIFPQQTGGPH